jgi:hypothetical protein
LEENLLVDFPKFHIYHMVGPLYWSFGVYFYIGDRMKQEIFDEIVKAARNNPTLSTTDIICEALAYTSNRRVVGRHDAGGNAYANHSTNDHELLKALKNLNRMRLCA